MRAFCILLMSTLFLFSACEKAIDQVEEYPLGEITYLHKTSDPGILVEGKGLSQGFYGIEDSGVAWFTTLELPTTLPPLGNSQSLGRPLASGKKFSITITENIVIGHQYHIRFYHRISSGVIYSPAKSIVF